MKRYTVAQVRQRLAEAFDSAERGEAVVIERRGVRFRLEAERPRRRSSSRPVLIEFVDPAVEEGRWSWTWRTGALHFSRRDRARRSPVRSSGRGPDQGRAMAAR